MAHETFIINNAYISSTHQKTDLTAFGHLYTVNHPIYHIPLHVISFFYLSAWRNIPSSGRSLVARRITYGVGLAALAIIGAVDGVIRLALALFAFAVKPSSVHPKTFLINSCMGFLYSLSFITKYQVDNILKEKIF